ncbi:MAG: SDR family oxidoreductase [Dehalococcoidia bacterium]|nr:SDR family oxidoreductase [Dehalococcoidia bacterium]
MALLDGKTALVTGAAVGLGNAFARALANERASVVVCDVRPDVAQLVAELQAGGTKVVGFEADVSVPADVRRVVDGALSAFGRIDVLVNNAGTWLASAPTDPFDKSLNDFEKGFGTNLKGVFMFGRAVIPQMIRQGGGDIVNIVTDHIHTCGAPVVLSHDDAPGCPWAGQPPRPTGGGVAMDVYDASKWGINGFTIAWAKALREHHVRVNALCMGATDSHMLRSFHQFNPPAEQVAMWMKPTDTARLLVDLLREGPDGRSGENIGLAMGHPVVLPPRQPEPQFASAH